MTTTTTTVGPFSNTTETASTGSFSTPPSTEGMDQQSFHQLGILAGAVFFWAIFAWCIQKWRITSNMSAAAAQAARRLQEVQEEEKRRKFVEDHLKSVEWNDKDVEQGRANDAEATEDECPVCLAPFCSGDMVSSSTNQECPHIFHRECIQEWLLKKTECPMCRKDFLLPVEAPECSQALTEEEDDLSISERTAGADNGGDVEEGRDHTGQSFAVEGSTPEPSQELTDDDELSISERTDSQGQATNFPSPVGDEGDVEEGMDRTGQSLP